MNTSGVERNNLHVRQHSRRLGRKKKAFSKDRDYLAHQLTLAFAYYHFVIPYSKPASTLAKTHSDEKGHVPLTKSGDRLHRPWPV